MTAETRTGEARVGGQGCLRDLTLYFLGIGAFVFGGPIALVARMQRDLVERRQWFTLEDYLEGFAFGQLAPGPLATQLAMYLGWLRAGAVGATSVALALHLPSFLMIIGLSIAYLRFGHLAWMHGVFYGVGAAVVAIIARSAWRLMRMAAKRDWLLWGLLALAALITAITQRQVFLLLLLSGIANLAVRSGWRWNPPQAAPLAALAPGWLLTGLHGPASLGTLWGLGSYFAAAGALVFGGGLTIIPLLYPGVVVRFHWLTDQQFLDAVAMGLITPGPVLITVAFIGYLVAGLAGACVAGAAVILPCYLIVVLGARYYRRVARIPAIKYFVAGVTASAIGALCGSVWILGHRSVTDGPTAAIAVATLLVPINFPKIPDALLVFAAGLIGVAIVTLR